MNMSFERAAGACFGASCSCNCVPDAWGGETWSMCSSWACGSPDINPGGDINISGVLPTHGSNFMSLTCSSGSTYGEGESVTFCPGTALVSGQSYCFSLDLITRTGGVWTGSSRLVLYGGTSTCTTTQTLWTSPALNGTWATHSFCFIPTGNWNVISFRVINPVSHTSVVGVDRWISTDGSFPPCPLAVTSFTGACTGDGKVFKWTDAPGSTVKYFLLEQSTDGESFSAVDSIPSVADHSTSADYADTLPQFLDGYKFYRIAQIDVNGNISYSDRAEVSCGDVPFDVSLAPNPATDFMQLHFTSPPEGAAQVQIQDQTGRIVLTPAVESLRIDLSPLPDGMYFIQVYLPETGFRKVVRVMKG